MQNKEEVYENAASSRHPNADILEEIYGVKGSPGSWQYRITLVLAYVRAFFRILEGICGLIIWLFFSAIVLFFLWMLFYVCVM
ncbi:MAG: hypothetical protein RRY12_02610 [Cloacibacillus sp.]